MAKISAQGGPSHEASYPVDPEETYLVDDDNDDVTNATKGKPSLVRNGRLLTDEERAEWDGTQPLESSEKQSTSSDKSESKPPAHASDAESPSRSDKAEIKSSAPSTGGNTRKTG